MLANIKIQYKVFKMAAYKILEDKTLGEGQSAIQEQGFLAGPSKEMHNCMQTGS